MKLTLQALVCIGGKGARLSRPVSERNVPKSFICFGHKTALNVTLSNMRHAGVRNLVLAGETADILERGRIEALRAGFEGCSITLFCDRGIGVHGIPNQARHHLRDRFIFDAGHSMAPIDHYRRLSSTVPGRVAYSSFSPEWSNDSRYIWHKPSMPCSSEGSSVAIALPYMLDRRWITEIRACSFQLPRILKCQLGTARCVTVQGFFPPEFDDQADLTRVRANFVKLKIGALSISSSLDQRLGDSALRK